ncbi:Isochorismatase hydrolase [Lactarius deliciosus]|nr:Isochorismatase hydrolase [Lactarius deliciosus]
MTTRPPVETPTEYGNASSFWVEYPSGLVDLTRTAHLPTDGTTTVTSPPPLSPGQLDVAVDGQGQRRSVRINAATSAYVIIDMQNYFLHPEIRDHPTGLACVGPLSRTVASLRAHGVRILWTNWGLTDAELATLPPALVRGFTKGGGGGFGSEMGGKWGRLLMRGEANADLYDPLQELYVQGKAAGTDVWVHKNRMSALWEDRTDLDSYLKENGITTLLFAGVNADQCVLGTMVDAYYRGYDVITVTDTTATTSPAGGLENVVYNAGRSYGFLTDSERVNSAVSTKK